MSDVSGFKEALRSTLRPQHFMTAYDALSIKASVLMSPMALDTGPSLLLPAQPPAHLQPEVTYPLSLQRLPYHTSINGRHPRLQTLEVAADMSFRSCLQKTLHG